MFRILIPWLIVLIKVLISIPFLTMLERKALGYIQSRKGPKKVRFIGILQPIRDGAKLVLKELGTPSSSNIMLFWISPIISFLLMILAWRFFPSYYRNYFFCIGIVVFLCVIRVQVYTLLGSGWGSNRKYTLLGSVRGASQTISYEISLIIVIFLPCCFERSYSFNDFLNSSYWLFLFLFPCLTIWLISNLAETNRTPFDFAEGERELVSGFNIEYSAFEFACLFLAEYGRILLMSLISAVLFFPAGGLFYLIVGRSIIFFFVWIRGTLPRFRYDLLMNMAWKIFLPARLVYLLLIWII